MSGQCRASGLAQIEAIIDRLAGLRVLVVGDLLLDEYRVGDVDRVSPEAPVPIVRVQRATSELGGAANVARGVVSLGARCELIGLVGDDAEGRTLTRLLEESGIPAAGVLEAPGRPTSHKLRVVARAQQMLRLDREEDSAIEPVLGERVRAAVASKLEACDLVILEDYDKGLFGEGLAEWIIELAHTHRVPVMADPKCDLARFRGAALVKPNLDEALAFVVGSPEHFQGRRALLEKLSFALDGAEVVLTRGRSGMSGLDEAGQAFDVPTRGQEVYDVQGAGDTSMAALASCRVAGASLVDACIVANAAAAVVVEKMGTAAVGQDELRARLPEALAVFEGEA